MQEYFADEKSLIDLYSIKLFGGHTIHFKHFFYYSSLGRPTGQIISVRARVVRVVPVLEYYSLIFVVEIFTQRG